MEATLQEQMRASSKPAEMTHDEDSICCLADKFRALADETRLRMIQLLMARGEMCVCEFMPLLGLTQSNVSFHLKTLKHAGFVTSHKEGKWMHYSPIRGAFEQFRADFGGVFGPDLTTAHTRRNPECE